MASELNVYSNIIVYRSRGETSRIILSVPEKTCCVTSMAHGKSRAEKLFWTRMSCWPKT